MAQAAEVERRLEGMEPPRPEIRHAHLLDRFQVLARLELGCLVEREVMGQMGRPLRHTGLAGTAAVAAAAVAALAIRFSPLAQHAVLSLGLNSKLRLRLGYLQLQVRRAALAEQEGKAQTDAFLSITA